MKRRELLKHLGLGSLMTTFPTVWPQMVQGAVNSDRLWVVVTAPGAWDPVSFCNPHPSTDLYAGTRPMSHYSADMMGQAGKIPYTKMLSADYPINYGDFVEKYYRELLVINGIETNNGNHALGARISSSGLSVPTAPAFAAYAAATTVNADKLPLPFLAGGGYSNTTGLISKVPVDGVGNIIALLEPYQQNGNLMLSNTVLADLKARRMQLMVDQQQASQLPREILEQKAFYDSHLSIGELRRLKDFMPVTLSSDPKKLSIQYICAAMAAGMTISAQLSMISGQPWDTHDNHDFKMSDNLNNMFDNLDFLLEEAERQGIRDRLNLIVASDFGRTPFFNSDEGKDHWSVGSMLFLGPDFTGNRVVKLDDDDIRARKVDLNTLAPSDTGEIITMRHVFRTLRALTGTLNSELDFRFNLDAAPVPKLFVG